MTQELHGDRFDRYAIVTLGPDGIVSGDDGIRLFGSGVRSFSLSTIVGDRVTTENSKTGTSYTIVAGSSVTLRGYAFGDTQGSARVMFDGDELTDVVSWSPKRIELILPEDTTGEGELLIDRNGALSNPLQVQIVPPPPNAVEGWILYD